MIAAGLDGRFPSSDLASVYRNLDTLEEIGLVRHFHVGHGAGLYALAAPSTSTATPRASAAARTSRSTTTPSRRSPRVLREACGYEPQLVHFPIVGRLPGV